ncbi:hypothetical protein J6590_029385 [Homalodisca vitripennis]|nr:hypothetical protein J6590_029385 [Homalodisca vitripennis]
MSQLFHSRYDLVCDLCVSPRPNVPEEVNIEKPSTRFALSCSGNSLKIIASELSRLTSLAGGGGSLWGWEAPTPRSFLPQTPPSLTVTLGVDSVAKITAMVCEILDVLDESHHIVNQCPF